MTTTYAIIIAIVIAALASAAVEWRRAGNVPRSKYASAHLTLCAVDEIVRARPGGLPEEARLEMARRVLDRHLRPKLENKGEDLLEGVRK